MKHKTKPAGTLIAALDIGTTKVVCLIARIVDSNKKLEIIGVGHQAAKGMKAGTVVDIDAAETAIRQAVHTAENMAAEVMKGYPLRHVLISLAGLHCTSQTQSVDVQISGYEVTNNDIRRALARAQDQIPHKDVDLIHTIPVDFSLDGHEGIREPRGMYGQTLGVDIHVVTGNKGAIRNLATCVERSHLDISGVCCAPYAAGLSSLVEDEMELGCTVIDMGGGVTSVAMFENEALVHVSAVPVGGQHVTNDIARGLTTPVSDAERLKTLYGSAISSTSDENEMIDVPPLGEQDTHQPNHVPRSYLVNIIQPRLEEIFELVRTKLDEEGVDSSAGRRVVLTGGGSQIPGLRDLAQKLLNKQVRLGRPVQIDGLPESLSGPAFSASTGLLLYSGERSDEMPAEIMRQVEPGNLWESVRAWLRDNW